MEVVGEYEYSKKDLIGHGAFAVVFKGRYRKNHSRPVAIKSITKKNLSKSQNLLGKEIKILKELTQLNHENVVALLDCKETTHHVYLVMEYCNGGDLADYLHAKGTLSEDTIMLFLKQIAAAMKALTSKGIVHRDLKPQNILLCHFGKTNPSPTETKLKIADFGFARFLNDGVMAATLCGSPMYMAPEVIMSLQYCAKADLWSIGTIVFQCLTGKAPFQAQTPQALKQFYEKNNNLVPNIPGGTSPDLKDLLSKLLKRNAKDRIDFDDFFNHRFIRPELQTKASSPLPVPNRNLSFVNDPLVTPTGIQPINESPLSGRMPTTPPSPAQSPSCNAMELDREAAEEEQVPASPDGNNTGGVTATIRNDSNSSSPVAGGDFVMVPANLPIQDMECANKPLDNAQYNAAQSSAKHHQQSVVTFNPKSDGVTYCKRSSPTRPSELQIHTRPMSGCSDEYPSEPIPVPSQVENYNKMQQSNSTQSLPQSDHSMRSDRSDASPCRPPKAVTGVPIPRTDSAASMGSAGSAAPIASLSPPAVQFMIGTPPNLGRVRSSSASSQGTPPPASPLSIVRAGTTPPSCQGSPHRRWSTGTPPTSAVPLLHRVPTPSSLAQPGLPTITDSPVKGPYSLNLPAVSGGESPTRPLRAAFGGMRAQTMPANMVDFAVQGNEQEDAGYESGAAMFRRSNSGGRLTEQLLKAALTNGGFVPTILYPAPVAGQHIVMPYRDRAHSGREFQPSTEPIAETKETREVEELYPGAVVPQSPPNMEGPIYFVAPELPEETILEKEHNETLAKLNFVLALVDYLYEIAKSREGAIGKLTESFMNRGNEMLTQEHIAQLGDDYRRTEQFVIYMRVLHLVSSAMSLAREEIKVGRLQPSQNVRNAVKELNEYHHKTLAVCKTLKNKGVFQADQKTRTVTANKIIYNYAIEMCHEAALDELFGNVHDSFRRYQMAQVLLHSLSQVVSDEQDRDLLCRYKQNVEKRLFVLESHGLVTAYDN